MERTGFRCVRVLKWGDDGPMEQETNRRENPVATIRASCPTCGDVELTSGDVTVRVCAADDQGSYAFRCPQCALSVSKLADPKIVDLLVSSGVHLDVWHLPAELAESHDGAVITFDDILDFHYELQQDGWFERLVSRVDLEDQA
ncbi:MAG: hypothetical protein NVS3B12_19850 [Acidimicrobiales bacterium]